MGTRILRGTFFFVLAVWGIAGSSATSAGEAGNVTQARVQKEARTGENWFLKGGNFQGQHYSPLSQVNDRNVDRLALAWSTELASPDGIAATPIAVDGVIYISGAHSLVFALDAETGRILWHYDPEVSRSFGEHSFLSWVARASRGLAVWDGRVFVATADCRLIALDAVNGKEVWSKTTCDNNLGFFITDSPYVGGGKVFLGNGGSESQEKGRGYVSAYDAATGDLEWRFYIVPSHKPDENNTPALKMAASTWSGDALEKYGGGGHSWNEMTYDPDSNQLFFGTSGAYPYQHAERSPAGGSNLFLSSVVAVDADTGEYRWHYQTVDRDSWDYNATMNIVLADMRIHGEKRETLLIAPKNGFHYTLDRHTGELLAVGKFARTNWASDIDLETGKPVYDPAGEFWNLEENETAYLWPNNWGAHNWHPMAYHPGTNLTYVPVVDAPALVDGSGEGEAIVDLTEVDGKPHASGKLVAMDPKTGKVRWRVEHELPFNGGLMATGGNLLFQGLGTGNFEAYRADSGDKLRRSRGRRGLDILNRLRTNNEIDLRIHEHEMSEMSDQPVDMKLVILAKHLNGKIVTGDFNLNKVARLNNVGVINLNDLANALKPDFLPGEHVEVRIVKPGEEARQGVGYLDDGTMIVVEGGRDHINKLVRIAVTSVHQTSAGRMVFGKYDAPAGVPQGA